MNDGEMNSITLQFPEELEQEFRDFYFPNSLQHVRLGWPFGILLYSIFGILDVWFFCELNCNLLQIRYFIVLPFLMLVYLCSFFPYFKLFMQSAISVSLILAGLSVVAMTEIVPPTPVSYEKALGLIPLLIFCYTFIPLSFWYSTLTAWVIVIAYEITALAFGTPIPNLVVNNFLLLSSSSIGMFASYNIEVYIRQDFLKDRRLQAEREKSERLEQKVIELKIEIDQANREREVKAITETDYFQEILEQSKSLRDRSKNSSDSRNRDSGVSRAVEHS